MTYTLTYEEWSGQRKPGRPIGRVGEVVKHTEAGADIPEQATVAQETRRLRAIDSFHRSLGWGGVGYSAVDFPSGRVYEGRGFFRSGAHTQGRNTRALAICTAGHGDRTAMTEAGIRGVRSWIGDGVLAGAITSDPKVSGHRDYANKSCPGSRIYAQLHRLRGVTGPESTPTPEPQEDVMSPEQEERVIKSLTRIEGRLDALDDPDGHFRRSLRWIAMKLGANTKIKSAGRELDI